jgi:hypothetical protein
MVIGTILAMGTTIRGTVLDMDITVIGTALAMVTMVTDSVLVMDFAVINTIDSRRESSLSTENNAPDAVIGSFVCVLPGSNEF